MSEEYDSGGKARRQRLERTRMTCVGLGRDMWSAHQGQRAVARAQ